MTETDCEGVDAETVGISDLPGVVVADGLDDGKAEAVAIVNLSVAQAVSGGVIEAGEYGGGVKGWLVGGVGDG